jgi:hypothetical protein
MLLRLRHCKFEVCFMTLCGCTMVLCTGLAVRALFRSEAYMQAHLVSKIECASEIQLLHHLNDTRVPYRRRWTRTEMKHWATTLQDRNYGLDIPDPFATPWHDTVTGVWRDGHNQVVQGVPHE